MDERSSRVIHFDDIDSTNSEALRHAAAGEDEFLWVVASRQTRGRGRQGRLWISEPGNLYTSVLVRPACTPALAVTLSFVAAIAVRDAVAAVAPELALRLRLKWPNDVICGGAKLAGILLESQAGGRPGEQGLGAVAIGIGVNCAHHPDNMLYPTTDLAEQGVQVAPESLLAALRAALPPLYALWAGGAGFPAIRQRWLDSAVGLGRRISITRPSGPLCGIFEGLDERGALIMRCEDALRTIAAGDVFFSDLEPPDRS